MPEDLCKDSGKVVKGQHAKLLRITIYRHSMYSNFHQRELLCSERSKSVIPEILWQRKPR